MSERLPQSRVSDERTRALADQWCTKYTARTGHSLYEVQRGSYTYVIDADSGRTVCAFGRSETPVAERDVSRQRGYPNARAKDDRGHIIANSMGGRMDMNLFGQDRHVNRGNDWREIERRAAANPGTPVAVHLRYKGDSGRPSRVDYAYEDGRGLHMVEFDNDRGVKLQERSFPSETRHRAQRSHEPSRDHR